MPRHIVLSVMSRDRVGIIAAVTKAIHELEGNIDAISQTVMRGYFTIILTVDFREDKPLEQIRERIERRGGKGELAVCVQERFSGPEKAAVKDGDQFVLTIMGADRAGIISRISAYLASRGINIVDLYAYTESAEFILIGQLMVPHEQDARQIQIDIEGLWRDSSLKVNLQHENIFVATNEIDFRHSKSTRAGRPKRPLSSDEVNP